MFGIAVVDDSAETHEIVMYQFRRAIGPVVTLGSLYFFDDSLNKRIHTPLVALDTVDLGSSETHEHQHSMASSPMLFPCSRTSLSPSSYNVLNPSVVESLSSTPIPRRQNCL